MFKKSTLVFLVSLLTFTSFSMAESPSSSSFHRFWPDNLFAVEFVNPQTGFIAGYSGTILRTKDGGENWEALYIGRNEIIRRMSFVDENTGWAVGHRGSIFHTEDAGQTWEVQKEIPGIYLRDVDFADKDNGWVVGHDMNIWHTSDAGKNWEQQKLLGFTGRDAPNLHSVYAKDAKTAILVGEFAVIGHTENAGEFWLTSPATVKTTWLSIGGTGDTAYVVGLDGKAIRLVHATEEQRIKIEEKKTQDNEKLEKRARAKAERMNREYVAKESEELPLSDLEYFTEAIKLPTREHLFDLSITPDGGAVAVGRSTVLKLTELTATEIAAEENTPLPYIWLGGVSVTSEGTFWAAGIRGLVAKGSLENSTIGLAFNLGNASNIELVSSRWGNK